MKSDAQMLADLIEISSPGPSGSSTSTTATPGGVDRTARMAIRYEDTYRREPDGWKIAERHLRHLWDQDTTVSR